MTKSPAKAEDRLYWDPYVLFGRPWRVSGIPIDRISGYSVSSIVVSFASGPVDET